MNDDAARWPNVTELAPVSPLPEIITAVPPAADPDPGDTPETTGAATVNVAVTKVSANVTAQGSVPEHPPPDQPANDEPPAGVAASVTGILAENCCAHVVPQSIPAGWLTTRPVPLPVAVTVTDTGAVTDTKVLPLEELITVVWSEISVPTTNGASAMNVAKPPTTEPAVQ